MGRWGLWILLAMGAFVVAHRNLVWVPVAFVVPLVIFYWFSLRLHPRRVCRKCQGTGRHQGAMFWWGDRACTTCGGSSRHRRWGVQVLHGAPGNRTWAENKARQAGRRRAAVR
jgi:hypothetical protein